MSEHQQFTFAVIGAGGRGRALTQWVGDHPDSGQVVAVADPVDARRQAIASAHDIPAENQFETWQELLNRPKLADVLLNTTMDLEHVDSSVKALDSGYHMLLEKPMATTLEDCIAIDEARRRNDRIVSVCHSQRYHKVYAELKSLLDEGTIGQLLSFDQLEGVGHLHMSHSFIRGNWGNEARSSFMLMTKSCHDIDLLAFLADRPCRRVSSFGALSYFKPENAPAGAPKYCIEGCPHESTCPYSAVKLYLHSQDQHWFAGHAGFLEMTHDEQLQALKTGPYGRCVWQTDNDVVDHQVVSLDFEGDVTATFTMTGLTAGGMDGRFIRLHGTEGCLRADIRQNSIDLWRFADNSHLHFELAHEEGGHGGADSNIMANLVQALRTNDPSGVLTGTAESLESHRIVFAAEKARREKRVVELDELD